MSKSRFIELMAKSMGKCASAEELAELDMFLEQFPDYKKTYQVTDALKGNDAQPAETKPEEINGNLEEIWNRIKSSNEDAEDNTKVRFMFRWQWVAAAVLVLAVTGGLLYRRGIQQDNSIAEIVIHEIHVPYGKTQKLKLPDGTQVMLNAGSTFSYPEAFEKGTRDVSLTGEGFFEVTKNAKKPFLVHTAKLVVKVLGTVFNVKAYNNDKTVETTLLKGKVQVELKNNPEKKIILLPNEKLIVINNRDPKSVKPKENKIEYQVTALPDVKPDEVKETAWVDNRILFTNEVFEDVAAQIERKYNVQVVFEDQALRTEQISGLLDKESLQEALGIIEMTTPFKFRVDGQTVYLSKKEK
ncbi:FecR family protein [Mucilaginibacter angelicae]|uniref:FecR family protein n=1 Tax=Mucilaginibacter angelicae TaxID=869718 RepID=A0ABV6KZ32_9SPHI